MEGDLIIKCIRQDRNAQVELYHLYKSTWFMICLRYLSQKADAEDALQNALIKIYTKMTQFDPAKGKFITWSNRIVVNECIMLLRKSKQVFEEPRMDQLTNSNQQVDEQTDILTAQEITALVNQLPIGYRTVFNMYVIEGYTHHEISNSLGISIGTSKSQLHKAKNMLKSHVEQLFKV